MSLARMSKTRKDPRTHSRTPCVGWRSLAAVLIALPLVGACGTDGFRPLYGSSSVGGANVTEAGIPLNNLDNSRILFPFL